jgi:hypothetical protein
MNRFARTAAVLSSLMFVFAGIDAAAADAAESSKADSPGVVAKAEGGIKHAASATARGVKRAASATARGIRRAASATARGVEHGASATKKALDR